MKKIFTLLLAAGVITTSFAQSNHQNGDKKGTQQVTNTETKKMETHRDAVYTFSAKEKQMQLAKVNHDFDAKVKSIVSNRGISKSMKKPLIQKAQAEKAQKIRDVNAKFDSKNNAAFNDGAKHSDTQKH